jgi:hypothetical protein
MRSRGSIPLSSRVRAIFSCRSRDHRPHVGNRGRQRCIVKCAEKTRLNTKSGLTSRDTSGLIVTVRWALEPPFLRILKVWCRRSVLEHLSEPCTSSIFDRVYDTRYTPFFSGPVNLYQGLTGSEICWKEFPKSVLPLLFNRASNLSGWKGFPNSRKPGFPLAMASQISEGKTYPRFTIGY